jgi:hypothetical protein
MASCTVPQHKTFLRLFARVAVFGDHNSDFWDDDCDLPLGAGRRVSTSAGRTLIAPCCEFGATLLVHLIQEP